MNEAMLDRIRKLIALGSDERTPEAERESAMTMASALMLKHAVDEQMLADAGEKHEEIISKTIEMPHPYSNVKATCAYFLAEALPNVKAVVSPGYRSPYHKQKTGVGTTPHKVIVIGYESDVEFYEMLFNSLSLQMVREANREYDKATGYTKKNGRRWHNTFFVAFFDAANKRVRNAYRKAAEEMHNSDPGTDIVLLSRAQQVQNAAKEKWPTLSKGSGPTIGAAGYSEGRAAGERADIGLGRVNRTTAKELQ